MANTVAEELQLIVKADTLQAERSIKQLQLDLAKLKGANNDQITTLQNEVTAYDDLIANMNIATESYQNQSEASQEVAKTSSFVSEKIMEASSAHSEQAKKAESSTVSYKRLGAEMLKFFGIGGGVVGLLKYMTSATVQLMKDQKDFLLTIDQTQAKLLLAGQTYEISMLKISSWAALFKQNLNITKTEALSAATSLATMTDLSSDLYEQIAHVGMAISLIFGDEITSSLKLVSDALKNPSDGLALLDEKGIKLDTTTRRSITTLLQQNRVYEAQIELLASLAQKIDEATESASIAVEEATTGLAGIYSNDLRLSIDNIFSKGGENIQQLLLEHSLGDLELALEKSQQTLEVYRLMGQSSSQIAAEERGKLQILKDVVKIKQEEAAVSATALQQETAALEAYLALLDEEARKTTNLQDLYDITATAQIKNLESKIAELKAQWELDKQLISQYEKAGRMGEPIDQDVYDQMIQRVSIYAPVIEQLTADLNALYGVAEETLFERIFGSKTASDYVMDIPISFIFGQGDQTRARLEAELATLKSIINELWTSSPAEDEIEKWQSELNIVIAKYDEIVSELEGINYLDGLRTEAERLLLTLLSDEEIKQMELNDLSERLLEMAKEGLITEDQRLAILQKQTTEVSNQVDHMEELKESLKEMLISSGAQGISELFIDFGAALSSGTDLLGALGESLGDSISQMTKQISAMAIAAGLRIIAESGVSGLPIALGLFALGGATGLVGGFFGASGKGVDTAVLEGMEEEVKARQALTKELQKSLDTEYELLKRQLDRNLISQKDFRSGAADLYRQQLLGEAKNALGSNAMGQITNLNTDLVSMSGWTKFWTHKDEDLIEQIAQIEALFYAIDQITNAEELNKMIAQLAALGVLVGDIPRFAQGGDFITDGPQLIMVGDNPGGRERVQVTPLGSTKSGESSETVIIQINAPVYGVEDLYTKLQEAGKKLNRRGIA